MLKSKGMFNSRFLISEYFDSLINEIDIFFEERLKMKSNQSPESNSEEFKSRTKAIDELKNQKKVELEKVANNNVKIEYDPFFEDQILSQIFLSKFCSVVIRDDLKYAVILIVDSYLDKKFIRFLK
jgi:hypothetical protein